MAEKERKSKVDHKGRDKPNPKTDQRTEAAGADAKPKKDKPTKSEAASISDNTPSDRTPTAGELARAARKAARQAERDARKAERLARKGKGKDAEKSGVKPKKDRAEKDTGADAKPKKAERKQAKKAELNKLPLHVKKADLPAPKPKKPAAPKAAREPQNTPAELADPPGAVRDGASFNILIVAQEGFLARQAVLFAASLRQNSPRWKGRLIVAEPVSAGPWSGVRTAIPAKERVLLTRYGAELLPFTARHFGRSYPYGNKIEALMLLPPGKPFVFFDSDTLILGELSDIPFDFNRPSASMRREATWPVPPLYGPGYAEIWKSLYDRFGLDFESSLDLAKNADDWDRYLYFNAGWFYGADPHEFGRRFLSYALEIWNEPGPQLACQSLDPWLDQVALPLVIHSLGGGRPSADLDGLDGDLTTHYRNFSLLYARESDATLEVFETLVADPEIAAVLRESKGFVALVGEGRGRSEIRSLYQNGFDLRPRVLRQTLKRQNLWFDV